ncbi:MAG TPA: hypothetical protein DCS55_19925 [Acidimicrobiaceae bacterium]|nr:hypothetical protein [Acidimicrobiaceae bacterium]
MVVQVVRRHVQHGRSVGVVRGPCGNRCRRQGSDDGPTVDDVHPEDPAKGEQHHQGADRPMLPRRHSLGMCHQSLLISVNTLLPVLATRGRGTGV